MDTAIVNSVFKKARIDGAAGSVAAGWKGGEFPGASNGSGLNLGAAAAGSIKGAKARMRTPGLRNRIGRALPAPGGAASSLAMPRCALIAAETLD